MIKIAYNWGTPLEAMSISLLYFIILHRDNAAYREARQLYAAFMRVNPEFWYGVVIHTDKTGEA